MPKAAKNAHQRTESISVAPDELVASRPATPDHSPAPTTTPIPVVTPSEQNLAGATTSNAEDEKDMTREGTLEVASPKQPDTAKHTPEKDKNNDHSSSVSRDRTPIQLGLAELTDPESPSADTVHSDSSDEEQGKSQVHNPNPASPSADTVHSDSSDDEQDKSQAHNQNAASNLKLILCALPIAVCFSFGEIRNGNYFSAFGTVVIAVCALKISNYMARNNENIQAISSDKTIEEGTEYVTKNPSTSTTPHSDKLNQNREEEDKSLAMAK